MFLKGILGVEEALGGLECNWIQAIDHLLIGWIQVPFGLDDFTKPLHWKNLCNLTIGWMYISCGLDEFTRAFDWMDLRNLLSEWNLWLGGIVVL